MAAEIDDLMSSALGITSANSTLSASTSLLGSANAPKPAPGVNNPGLNSRKVNGGPTMNSKTLWIVVGILGVLLALWYFTKPATS